MLCADFEDYVRVQDQVSEMFLVRIQSGENIQSGCLYRFQNGRKWLQMCLLNIASSGKFSSDRTVLEYAKDIWQVAPLPEHHQP